MSLFTPISLSVSKGEDPWKRHFSDSLLALGSIILLTGIIFLLHLYPRIPDSFLVYLLAILALASTRGLYAALLASLVAFFSFDFLFIPPLYSLIAAKFEDVLALIVFLITAIITSQFASALRQRADDANRRERETRILYDLVRTTNREEEMERQLHSFARSLIEVFSPLGIRDCMLLLPDAAGILTPEASAYLPRDQIQLSPDEEMAAAWAMAQACSVDLSNGSLAPRLSIGNTFQTQVKSRKSSVERYVRLVPLKTNQKVVGVLWLLIEDEVLRSARDNILGIEHEQPAPQAVFFSTFLEQAVAAIERGRLRRESIQMKVLQQTDALRASLLSSVSHDLRTPLSTIKTAATSLLQKEIQWDEEALHSFASTIAREADRLNRLVANLLDMSRIEGGVLYPEKVWYPLDGLIHDVLARMDSQLQGRIVQIHLPDDLPPVKLDYVQIDQVITNLLENAVHYTPAGSPIDVSIEVQAEQMLVSIADRGPGVPLAEGDRIFDKFYRVLEDSHASGYNRGSGLGLAVCRGFVEAHGGRIWVEAREGGGAVFRFTLPRDKTKGRQR